MYIYVPLKGHNIGIILQLDGCYSAITWPLIKYYQFTIYQHKMWIFRPQIGSQLVKTQQKEPREPRKKSFSKDCTWHMSFLCWFIILNFVFWVPHLTLHFRYKYILTTNWFYIMYIMHSCPLSHKHETTFVKGTFSKFIIFKVKSTFNQMCSNWLYNKKSFVQSHFVILIIDVKILSNFQKEWCTFGF